MRRVGPHIGDSNSYSSAVEMSFSIDAARLHHEQHALDLRGHSVQFQPELWRFHQSHSPHHDGGLHVLHCGIMTALIWTLNVPKTSRAGSANERVLKARKATSLSIFDLKDFIQPRYIFSEFMGIWGPIYMTTQVKWYVFAGFATFVHFHGN